MRTMAEGLAGPPPCSHIHMFTTLAPHGLRARFVSGPRRCGPFPKSSGNFVTALSNENAGVQNWREVSDTLRHFCGADEPQTDADSLR